MAFGSLFLFVALLIIVSLIVARPLMEERVEETAFSENNSQWAAEYERMLDALAELDADWQLRKVPEEIYATQRQQLVANGARAMEEIEKAAENSNKPVKESVEGGDNLEKLIAAYKRRVRK